VIGVLLVVLSVLAQCSSDEPLPTVSSPISTLTPAPTPTSTPGPTATPFATPTAIPEPTSFVLPDNLERGGILRFAVPEGPPHTDPHLTVSSGLLSWGAAQAYSRLFTFDTSDGNALVICDLCESWTQSAPLTFSIQLRDDVVWQNLPPLNGRALTAQDVAFSLNRQATSGYPNSDLFSNVSEFTAVGELKLLIRLKAPDSEILEKLADSHSRIVAPEAVNVNGDLRSGPTVGTGPWVANEVQADLARMIINPDYYKDEIPYLDGLDIQVIPSGSTRIAGVRSRVIDLASGSFDAVNEARKRFDDIEWTGVPNLSAGVEVAINTTRSPMNTLAVREAMMLTWDPMIFATEYSDGSLADAIENPSIQTPDPPFGQIGTGVPLTRFDWQLPTDELASRFNNPDEANSLLSSAALKPTDNVVIKVGEFGEDYIDQANAMAEGLASVGIRADVERVTTRVFGDDVWIGGDFDIAVGAPPPVSSTTGYLFAVHHSNGPWNSTGYADPEIDRLIEAQAKEYDAVKRGDLLIDLQRRILAGSHRFIAQSRTTYWMWWNYVNDFNPVTPRGDTDFLTRVWMTERPS
jgi:peptide/nickel transport system substrate-binding protein